MSGIRHQQALKAFLDSPEAKAPLPRQDYHDEVRPAASTTREIAERRERIAREETYESAGRNGLVSEGGSIAFERTRSKQESAAPVLDAKAQQAAITQALEEMGATPEEFRLVREQVKALPLQKLMDIKLWTSTLERVRRVRRGAILR
jgi:hypothetical protein